MSYYTQIENGAVRLKVRLSPKAKREGIESVYTDANGGEYLKIAVSAPAVDGKANKALIALLAKRLKIAKSCFEIVSGQTDRSKTLVISNIAEPERLITELNICPKSSTET